ncbi:hypothetical protein ACMA5I_09985 [Paracoccaceae bacterium GXU_MW_L88]
MPETESACVDAGGTWGRFGMAPVEQCLMPTPDAGQVCDSSADCVSACEANEDRTGGTCADVTPRFGCFALWENGNAPTLCVD